MKSKYKEGGVVIVAYLYIITLTIFRLYNFKQHG